MPGPLLLPSLQAQPEESIWEAAASWAEEALKWPLGLVPTAAIQEMAHALLQKHVNRRSALCQPHCSWEQMMLVLKGKRDER